MIQARPSTLSDEDTKESLKQLQSNFNFLSDRVKDLESYYRDNNRQENKVAELENDVGRFHTRLEDLKRKLREVSDY